MAEPPAVQVPFLHRAQQRVPLLQFVLLSREQSRETSGIFYLLTYKWEYKLPYVRLASERLENHPAPPPSITYPQQYLPLVKLYQSFPRCFLIVCAA